MNIFLKGWRGLRGGEERGWEGREEERREGMEEREESRGGEERR